jgi:hypothetical protein
MQPPFHNHFSCKEKRGNTSLNTATFTDNYRGQLKMHTYVGQPLAKETVEKPVKYNMVSTISYGFIHSHYPGVNSCSHLFE